MPIEFPRIERPIRLGDYQEELGDLAIPVWVNVPRRIIQEIGELPRVENAKVMAWLSEIWGPDWPAETIQQLFEKCMEQDPALWHWLLGETLKPLLDYRNGVKKN